MSFSHGFDTARHGYRLARAIRHRAFREADLTPIVTVDAIDPGFLEGEVAYNGLGLSDDGTIYFSIGTKALDAGARVFSTRPEGRTVRLVADLDEALRDAGAAAVPHGKMHVDFETIGGRLYGGTHVGHYAIEDGLERPHVPAGRRPFPGGMFFELMPSGLRALGSAPAGEGIIAMAADADRSRLHALTWPAARLLTLDLVTAAVVDRGAVLGAGELGSRREGTWHRVCRSLGTDPRTGHVYWSDREGRIARLSNDDIGSVAARIPSRDMWRKVVWERDGERFYVLTESSRLAVFDPRRDDCREIGALSGPGSTRRATLAFALDPERGELHHLAMGPGAWRGLRHPPLLSTVWHCIWNIRKGSATIRGALRLADGRWVTEVQSLLITHGRLYATMWVEVAPGDCSARSDAIRRRRQPTEEYRARGYAEEIVFASLPASP